MNREIKFRAWDTELEFFADPVLYFVGLDGSAWFNNCEGGEDSMHDQSSKLIVEQFIGLYDKNGKEMFEGDIVRNFWTCKHKDTGKPPTYTIVFKEGSFQFWAGEEHGNYKSVSKIWWPAEYAKPDNWEVIGNIHETPELLEAG